MTKVLSEKVVIHPLTTTIGARIEGVDITRLSEDEAEIIRTALDDHAVLVIPKQFVGVEAQSRFAEIFGPLEPLPALKFLGCDSTLVIEDLIKGRKDRPASLQWGEHQGWHTDSSFTAQIPRAAILRGEILSPVGGGTTWTSMCAAFEDLSEEMQRWLSTLRAVHAEPMGYREAIGLNKQPEEVQRAFAEKFPTQSHPIVVEHPRSGRRGLFVNPTYTVNIEGLSYKESRHVLNFLFTHIVQADFVYRHRWEEGDIVVWDELATLHLAPDDYAPHRRRMVRVTAGIETPTAPWLG